MAEQSHQLECGFSPRWLLCVSRSLAHYSSVTCYLRRIRNIWICSEGCNFRSFPTLIIPLTVCLFWSLSFPPLLSIGKILRSNHQVTDRASFCETERDQVGTFQLQWAYISFAWKDKGREGAIWDSRCAHLCVLWFKEIVVDLSFTLY